MKLNDIVLMSFNSLTHRKLRSWLTVLGIVVGVAAFVGLVSIGQGLQQSIQNQLGGLGANIITVSPGFERAAGGFSFGGGEGGRRGTSSSNLTQNDIRTIRATPGVQYVDGIVSGRADATFSGETASLSIQGVDTSVWRFMVTSKLQSGRYLSEGDEYAAVIGNSVANNLYKHNINLDNQISIDGHNFRVVGILQASSGLSFGGADSVVYVPSDNARQVITDSLTSNQFSSISVQIFSTADLQTVSNQITSNLLLTRHKTTNTQDFTVSSPQALQQQISTITGTITLFLGGIAGISLLVGGIGIANTMFMSVIERTKQIGVLKSLGTTNSEVMKLFLTESGLIGLIGGIIGVIFGIILSGLISLLGGGGGIGLFGVRGGGGGGGLHTVVTPEIVLLAIGFSVLIGAISGLFPARRASKLEPVEALRYE